MSVRTQRTYQNALDRYRGLIENGCSDFNLDWMIRSLQNLSFISPTYVKSYAKKLQKVDRITDITDMMKISAMATCQENTDVTKIMKELQIKKSTVKKYLSRLQKLRWLKFHDWFYEANPFLNCLVQLTPKEDIENFLKIFMFASNQIDLLYLFSLPLLEALEDDITNVSFVWAQIEPNFENNYFGDLNPNHFNKMYPFWSGLLQIKAESATRTYYTILPYNIHFDGKKPHITLPIPFTFYGIESAQYSKDELKVHYDSSVTASISLGSATWHHRKLNKMANLSHWSNSIQRVLRTHWANQYSECSNFMTHEKLIRRRLIEKTEPTPTELKKGEIILNNLLSINPK